MASHSRGPFALALTSPPLRSEIAGASAVPERPEATHGTPFDPLTPHAAGGIASPASSPHGCGGHRDRSARMQRHDDTARAFKPGPHEAELHSRSWIYQHTGRP